jgi:hypothetical protein
MNHTQTVNSVAAQLNVANALNSTGVPFILGETNSLYNEGAPGLSNAYGAALVSHPTIFKSRMSF